MAEYQNILTQVQVRGPAEMGLDEKGVLAAERGVEPRFMSILGYVGNAQIGPLHLGMFGTIALFLGATWFFLVGIGMLQSVGWSWQALWTNLWWISLDPPRRRWLRNASLMGRRSLFDSKCLFTTVCLSWWIRSYLRAEELGMGKHVCWAFAAAIWLFLVIGLFRPVAMGTWSEMVPYGIFPHLDWTNYLSLNHGNLFYNPFHALSIAFPFMDQRYCLRCMVLLFWQYPGLVVIVSWSKSMTEELHLREQRFFGDGLWVSMRQWKVFIVGVGGSLSYAQLLGGIGILLTGTVVDDWFSWAVAHGFAVEGGLYNGPK